MPPNFRQINVTAEKLLMVIFIGNYSSCVDITYLSAMSQKQDHRLVSCVNFYCIHLHLCKVKTIKRLHKSKKHSRQCTPLVIVKDQSFHLVYPNNMHKITKL